MKAPVFLATALAFLGAAWPAQGGVYRVVHDTTGQMGSIGRMLVEIATDPRSLFAALKMGPLEGWSIYDSTNGNRWYAIQQREDFGTKRTIEETVGGLWEGAFPHLHAVSVTRILEDPELQKEIVTHVERMAPRNITMALDAVKKANEPLTFGIRERVPNGPEENAKLKGLRPYFEKAVLESSFAQKVKKLLQAHGRTISAVDVSWVKLEVKDGQPYFSGALSFRVSAPRD